MFIYEGYRDLSNNTLISENKNNVFPQHFHRNIEILYVRDGMMKATINNQTYECCKDEIIFVPHFFMHEFSTPEQSDVVVLLIPYEMMSDFNDFFKEKQLSPFLNDCEYNKNILKVLTLLLDVRPYNNQYIAKGFISIILGLLINHYPLQRFKNTGNFSTLTHILEYINDNYKNDISLETIADSFNYNKYYISHLFKQTIGENFKKYINTLRIQHIIAAYTQEKKQNLSSIVFQCGFNNMQTFYRCFHEIYQTSPKEYMNKLLIDNVEYNKLNY